MTDYRAYLKAVGRKPIPRNIRTERRPRDVEIVYSPAARDWVRVVVGAVEGQSL